MWPPLVREMSNYDLVHIHSVSSFTSSVAMIAARQSGVPYVIQPHGSLDSYHWQQSWLKKSLYSNTVDAYGIGGLSGVIFSSEHEMLQGKLVLRSVAPFMVPLGVASNLLSNSPRPPDNSEFELLFLGRVTQKKRVDIVINALAHPRLKARNIHLTIAGPIDGRLSYDPKILAHKLGVADRITFIGQVDAQQRLELLQRASIFVLPSEDESFGMAVAEAMAVGCPVITTKEVGLAQRAAEDGALMLCALSSDQFALRIGDMLDSQITRLHFSENGRCYARANFTWQLAAEAALNCYRTILSPKDPT